MQILVGFCLRCFLKVSKFQSFESFKASKFQHFESFKVSKFQHFESFKVSKFQNLKVSKFQSFKSFKVSKFLFEVAIIGLIVLELQHCAGALTDPDSSNKRNVKQTPPPPAA